MTPSMNLGRWLAPLALTAVLAAPAPTLRAGPFTWAGPGNVWSNAGNWMPAGGPPQTAGDSATISSGPAVSLDIDPTIDAFTMNSSAASLSITNHTLTVTGPSNLTQGRVVMTNATWAGAGTLTIGASAFLTAAAASTIQDPISLSGTLTAQSIPNAFAVLSLAKDLTNNGTIQMSIPAGDFPTVQITVNGGKGTLTIAAGQHLKLLGTSFINDRTPTAAGMIVGSACSTAPRFPMVAS